MSTAPPTTAAPTTLAPTTLAPTTAAPTTLAPTTAGPTTAPPTAAPSTGAPVLVYTTPLIIYCDPIEITLSQHGFCLNNTITDCAIDIVLSQHGAGVDGILVDDCVIDIDVTLHHRLITTVSKKCNFVAWSKIGSADFTQDKSNEAGERPMDWRGCVYSVLKLGEQNVVYGENGVTVLKASGVHWGMQTIHRLGLKSRYAVVGTDFGHYFIDNTDKLYELTQEGLKLLDYSEYLSLMTDPIMSMDLETGIIYICDNEYGYVYSTKYNSFGSGPINVTGVGTQTGAFYSVAPDPDEIEIPKFHICTDIYDLGSRKPKTIQWLEIGTDLTDRLEAMVEARISNKDNFIRSAWKLVNPSGIAYTPCYGVEFKFHVKSYIYEYLELDFLRVVGSMHGFDQLDAIG